MVLDAIGIWKMMAPATLSSTSTVAATAPPPPPPPTTTTTTTTTTPAAAATTTATTATTTTTTTTTTTSTTTIPITSTTTLPHFVGNSAPAAIAAAVARLRTPGSSPGATLPRPRSEQAHRFKGLGFRVQGFGVLAIGGFTNAVGPTVAI